MTDINDHFCPFTKIIIRSSFSYSLASLFRPGATTVNLQLDVSNFDNPLYPPTTKFSVDPNDADHYYVIQNYACGLTLIEQKFSAHWLSSGKKFDNLIIYNKGDIVIDSSLTPQVSSTNITIISCNGSITLNEDIQGNTVTLMAPKGTLTVNKRGDCSGNTLVASAQHILNDARLRFDKQIALSGSVINTGNILAPTILTQQAISGSGTVNSTTPTLMTSAVSDQTLVIAGLTQTHYFNPHLKTISSTPNDDGVSFDHGGIQIINKKNLDVTFDPELENRIQEITIITPGIFTLDESIILNSSSITIIADQIITQDINVSGNRTQNPNAGDILLIGMNGVQTGNLIADAAQFSDLNGLPCSQNGSGYLGASGNQTTEPLYSGSIAIISGDGITTSDLSSKVDGSGGDGGSGCSGSTGANGADGSAPTWMFSNGDHGDNGELGGAGGKGGTGGMGAHCASGYISLIAAHKITTRTVVAYSKSNGGRGGAGAGGGTGGKGGNGGNAGSQNANAGGGGRGGNGGKGGDSGNGGDGKFSLCAPIFFLSTNTISTQSVIVNGASLGGQSGETVGQGGTAGAGGNPGFSWKGSGDRGSSGAPGAAGVRGGNGVNGKSSGGLIALVSCDDISTHVTNTQAGNKALDSLTAIIACGTISMSDFTVGISAPSPVCKNTPLNTTLAINSDRTHGTINWLGTQIPLRNHTVSLSPPTVAGTYPLYAFFSDTAQNLIGIITKAVDFRSVHIFDFHYKNIAPGSDFILYQVNAQNGSGKTHISLLINTVMRHETTIDSRALNGKIFWCDRSRDETICVADFNPQLSDNLYNVRPVVLPADSHDQYQDVLSSISIDIQNQKIYFLVNDSLYQGTIILGITNEVDNVRQTSGRAQAMVVNNNFVYNVNFNEICVGEASDDGQNVFLTNQRTLATVTQQPTSLTIDAVHNHLYWTTDRNELWTARIDDLNTPSSLTQITQLLVGPELNRPTGVSVNPSTGAIYWINNANTGELWQGVLNDKISPTHILSTKLIRQGGFSLDGRPVILAGLFMIFDELPTYYFGCDLPGGENTVTLIAYDSDMPTCSDSVQITVNSRSPIRSGTAIKLDYSGSSLSIKIDLPPELTFTNTSDITSIFNDLCTFANQQPFGRFLAGFEVLAQFDVFPGEAAILDAFFLVFISCSDNNFQIQGAYEDFTFITHSFVSDTVTVTHSESSVGTTTKTMVRTGYEVLLSNNDTLWVSPCDSDPLTLQMLGLYDHPLVSVDAEFSPITQIGTTTCIPVYSQRTSDARYVCHLCNCAHKTGDYLTQHFPNCSDLPLNPCHVTYTGEIIADVAAVNLENCTICFAACKLPDCSDAQDCM